MCLLPRLYLPILARLDLTIGVKLNYQGWIPGKYLMASSSAQPHSDAFVAERDIDAFRSIFEQEEAETKELKDSTGNLDSQKETEEDIDLFKMKVAVWSGLIFFIILTIFVATSVYFIFFAPSDSFEANQSAPKEPLKYQSKGVYELTMTPDPASKITVYALRTTQPPPSYIADASNFLVILKK